MKWPLRRKPVGRRSLARGGIVRRGLLAAVDQPDGCYVPPARPRADHVQIAVLEHELFGITPEPGTLAAATVNLTAAFRRLREAEARPVDPEACPHEDVVETTQIGTARPQGLCTRCGRPAVEGDDGAWTFP